MDPNAASVTRKLGERLVNFHVASMGSFVREVWNVPVTLTASYLHRESGGV